MRAGKCSHHKAISWFVACITPVCSRAMTFATLSTIPKLLPVAERSHAIKHCALSWSARAAMW